MDVVLLVMAGVCSVMGEELGVTGNSTAAAQEALNMFNRKARRVRPYGYYQMFSRAVDTPVAVALATCVAAAWTAWQ